jgi:hypothetical protein
MNAVELKAIVKGALKEALRELIQEGAIEIKVVVAGVEPNERPNQTPPLNETDAIKAEPTEPNPPPLIETEPSPLSVTEPVEVVTEPTTSVTEPANIATKPIKAMTEPTESAAEPIMGKVEPAEPTPSPLIETEPAEPIDLEPLKAFILNAPTDQLNDFILNSDHLFAWLHETGIYPDILKDRVTLWDLIKGAIEAGALKLQVSVNFFPDPDDDPAGWIVGAGKSKDAGFRWDGCRDGIKEGYLTLKRYNEWLTPHDFLNLLLRIKDYDARLRFIYDLAVLETAPELANPQTLNHLRKFRLDYPTPPPNREIPISSLVDRITGRWGQECGLGNDERTERVLTYLNANLKVTPDEGVDVEPPENPLANILLSAEGGGGDDSEVAQARQILKAVFMELAKALLPNGWETMPMRDLQRRCAPLFQLVHKDPTLKALAIKARYINP